MSEQQNHQQRRGSWNRNQPSPIYYQAPTPWSPPPIFDGNVNQSYR